MIDRKSNMMDEAEEKVALRPIAGGLLDQIPRPMSDKEDPAFELIEFQGEAVSDMIISERR